MDVLSGCSVIFCRWYLTYFHRTLEGGRSKNEEGEPERPSASAGQGKMPNGSAGDISRHSYTSSTAQTKPEDLEFCANMQGMYGQGSQMRDNQVPHLRAVAFWVSNVQYALPPQLSELSVTHSVSDGLEPILPIPLCNKTEVTFLFSRNTFCVLCHSLMKLQEPKFKY